MVIWSNIRSEVVPDWWRGYIEWSPSKICSCSCNCQLQSIKRMQRAHSMAGSVRSLKYDGIDNDINSYVSNSILYVTQCLTDSQRNELRSGMALGMWRSQLKSASVGCGFHMKNPLDANVDLSPHQNSLVSAIIATAIQLSYFCLRL